MEMFEYNYTAMIGLIIGGLILLKYFSNKAISPFPIFAFPSDKRKNFYIIQKGRFYHFYHPYMLNGPKSNGYIDVVDGRLKRNVLAITLRC